MKVNVDLFELARNNPRPLAIMSVILIISAAVLVTVAVVSGDDNPPNFISSHVLDIAAGVPAADVNCTAFLRNDDDGKWTQIAKTKSNEAGRIPLVHPDFDLKKGIYKLQFDVADYFKRRGQRSFYPQIDIIFDVDDDTKHYHVPITISNYGYSTYKGQ